jgi:[ribosomal protein S18]-alanine N-acetyltransferase
MDELEIRVAAKSDVTAIHKLEEEAFPSPWRREFFESELRAEGRFNIVAMRHGKLVGYVFGMWFLDEMHVNKIAVVEEERRRGVAAKLMDRCFEFARANGVKMMSLEVRKSNTGAQLFYKQLDFHAAYLRPKYYPDGEAAVVMTRSV